MKRTLSVILLCCAVTAFGQDLKTLRYGYELGKPYLYAVTSQTNLVQEMSGREIITDMGQNAKMSIVPQSVADNGDFSCWISFSEMSVKIKNMQMDTTLVMSSLLGKRTEIVHTPTGKVLSASMIDTLAQMDMMMQQLGIEPATLLKRVLVKLPVDPVPMGGSWTETEVDTIKQGGITIAVTPNIAFTLMGEEERSGLPCLKIAFKGTLSLAGSGSQMGANIGIEGEGSQEGIIHFAPVPGVLVSAESSTEQESTIAITGPMTMTIPQNSTIKSSLVYLP